MARQASTSRTWGLIVGGGLLIAGLAAVALVDWTPRAPQPPAPIRPVKSMVIDPGRVSAGHQYPGRVRASEQVVLAFQVNGPIVELPVSRGQKVRRGDLLARLDPRDYQNTLQARQAEWAKARSDLDKLRQLHASGAATQRELTDAQARFDVAQSQVEIARKAVDDTQLLAPFDGTVADKFVDAFQNVQAKQPILSLQDVSTITIEVGVPEQRIIRVQRGGERGRYRFVAVFDFLPDREFEVQFREIATEADSLTQLYRVTFEMPSPEQVTILPGMTASIREYLLGGEDQSDPDLGHLIPLSAAGIDGQGQYFVWKLEPTGGELFTARRVNVKAGPLSGDQVVILEGLSAGDRVATAGVTLLTEGQRVRLYVPKAQPAGEADPS